MKLIMRMMIFWDNVDDGVVDEGAGMGIVVSKGYKRNAPVGKENMAERQWDEISTDEDELELPDSNGRVRLGLTCHPSGQRILRTQFSS